MISKFRIRTADMIRIALHTLQLQYNSILFYYTVAEMHVFLPEVDTVSELVSRSRVLIAACSHRRGGVRPPLSQGPVLGFVQIRCESR